MGRGEDGREGWEAPENENEMGSEGGGEGEIGGGEWPGRGGWAPPPAEELDLELGARFGLLVLFLIRFQIFFFYFDFFFLIF